MGLSSSGSGAPAAPATAPAHQNFGDALMGMIKQKYPIAGAIGNAVGIGHSSSPTVAPATSVGAPAGTPPPQFDIGTGAAAPVDQNMSQAGQIGSQHSDFLSKLLSAITGGM